LIHQGTTSELEKQERSFAVGDQTKKALEFGKCLCFDLRSYRLQKMGLDSNSKVEIRLFFLVSVTLP
jgi:hypothetical protein